MVKLTVVTYNTRGWTNRVVKITVPNDWQSRGWRYIDHKVGGWKGDIITAIFEGHLECLGGSSDTIIKQEQDNV